MHTSIALLLVGCLAACSPVAPADPPDGSGTDRILWHVQGSGDNVRPSMDATTVYFGSWDHQVVAVDKSTGEVRWRVRTPITSEYPTYGFGLTGYNTVVASDVVAVGDVDLFAFDRQTSALRWMFRPADLDQPGHGFIVTDGSTIYTSSGWNRVYAVDAATGTQRWVAQLPNRVAGPLGSSKSFHPQLEDGVLFVGSKHLDRPVVGSISALDAATGRILWTHDFEAGYPGGVAGYLGLAAFHGPNVIAGVEDGRIYALDRTTGAARWTAPWVQPLPPAPAGSYGDDRPVVVAGDIVVAGSNSGIIVGLDATTSDERWRLPERIYITYSAMTTDGERVYLCETGGKLHVLDGATGAVQWVLGTGSVWPPADELTFLSGAVPDGDRLYIAAVDGFYALHK